MTEQRETRPYSYALLLARLLLAVNKMLKKEKRRFPSSPPEHPGVLMRDFVMPNLDLTADDVIKKTGISQQELEALFNCKARVDQKLKEKLRPALGDAVEILSDRQTSFDHFATYGRWPL